MKRRAARAALAAVLAVAVGAALLLGVRHWRASDPPWADVPCTADGVDALDLSDPALGEPVWADEFDGDAVDPDRWTVRDETTLSFDQARILARNVEVVDGTLRVTARPDAGDAQGRPATTGYLDTIGHFSRQFGRWEVRARLPVAPGESRGLWPAFWLRADDLPGEIDVVEAWGTPTSRDRDAMDQQYAWTVHEDTQAPPGYRKVGGWGRADAPLADDFHVFAVDWTPTCMRFSLDGRTTGFVDLEQEDRLAAALDDTVNIRLNLQVGSRYWGLLDPADLAATRLPATLEVDHVRVYRPRGS